MKDFMAVDSSESSTRMFVDNSNGISCPSCGSNEYDVIESENGRIKLKCRECNKIFFN